MTVILWDQEFADEMVESITVTRLSSGYWHIRGTGPCNWAQPWHWPCDEATLREAAFPEACDEFIYAVMKVAASEKP